MDRRTLLRNLLLLTGGVTMLPACLDRDGKASIALKNIEITAEQEKLLAEIAATIIPQTKTPGAKEAGAHLFVLKMLDDCYDAEDQQKFILGLDELDKNATKRFNHSFTKCTATQREQLLEAIEKEGQEGSEVFTFYKIMKEKTIQGYLTSKYVLINIIKYEMISSVPYNGYHLIKNTQAHGRQS